MIEGWEVGDPSPPSPLPKGWGLNAKYTFGINVDVYNKTNMGFWTFYGVIFIFNIIIPKGLFELSPKIQNECAMEEK